MSTKAPGDPAGKPIGVFLLDDHEIVRRGIRGLLEAEPDIQVIGEAVRVRLGRHVGRLGHAARSDIACRATVELPRCVTNAN